MNTRNDTGFRTFLVGVGGVSRNTRVKTPAAIVTAGAGEDSIGIALETKSAGEYCAVKLWSAPGTFHCVAAGVVHASDAIYGAAAGKVDDTVAGNMIGTALEAAAADGDVIEFLPAGIGDLFSVQAHVADAVTLTDNTGKSAGHDDTLAATTEPTTLTDNSGYSAGHDDTLAAVTPGVALLVGTLGGAADGTMETVGATNVGDVSGAIMNNFQEVFARVNTANAQLAIVAQNQSDVAQKVMELVTLAVVQDQNASDIGQKVIELVTKVNAILASLEANGIHLSS